MWLELSRCSHCPGITLLIRSFSIPVARADRPNSARNGLVMLPSAIAIDGLSFGMYVNGSGIALEYFSVVPLIWFKASISTSASSRRSG